MVGSRGSWGWAAAWLAWSVAAPSGAQVPIGIEVVASVQRDGFEARNHRQRIGVAEDGAIAFTALTPSGAAHLLIAEPMRNAVDTGHAAQLGSDVAIDDYSVLFLAGPELQTLRRDLSGPPLPILDCLDASTPCGGVRRLSMARDGWFALAAYDSYGGIYRGRSQGGAVIAGPDPTPVPGGFITAIDVDVRVGGPLVVLGDHTSASAAEVYGAFLFTPSRWGVFLNTAVSTRPRGGAESPLVAVYGGYETYALMPAQTDGAGTTLTTAALVRGERQPYRTEQVRGIPLLAVQSVAGGSLDVNDNGKAAAVATLQSGWTGLFSFDTNNAAATPVQHLGLGQRLGKCRDVPLQLYVLGMNDAGQVAVWARVQSSTGTIDTQVWRVTPGNLITTTSYCMSVWRPLFPSSFP